MLHQPVKSNNKETVNDMMAYSLKRILQTLKMVFWGTWLTQLEEHATLDLGVVSSSPMMGAEIFEIKQNKKQNKTGVPGWLSLLGI